MIISIGNRGLSPVRLYSRVAGQLFVFASCSASSKSSFLEATTALEDACDAENSASQGGARIVITDTSSLSAP